MALSLVRVLDAGEMVERAIRVGGPLHDVGKLAVSEEILRKRGPLDPDELIEIRKHPVTGAKMLGGIRSLRVGVDCVLHHHERWDGDGYPAGLAGEQIPIAGRIVAVADSFDAMTHDRPYRAASPIEEALSEIARCSASQFDPRVVEAFLKPPPARRTGNRLEDLHPSRSDLSRTVNAKSLAMTSRT
jgi:HD-GYP domain-containing protein (c-di-GMP phosphodiesterase class II)